MVRFLTLKGLNPQQIHSELESVYHDGALALPMIFKWHARFRDGTTVLSDDPRSGRARKSDLAKAFFSMLQEHPFSSGRFLADELALQKFDLRWVPHTLDFAQKRDRVIFSRALLEVLRRE
jgi:transposase